MEYKYASGEIIRLHDKLRAGNGLTGVVVEFLDDEKFDQSGNWMGGYRGIMVNTDEAVCVLYSDPEHIARFVKL